MRNLPPTIASPVLQRLQTLGPEERRQLIESLTPREAVAVLDDWDLWALPHQRMPEGVWRRWIIRAGRGGGKTHAGARTTNQVALDSKKVGAGELAIVARTWTDARQTMVEGPSGLLATAPMGGRPEWQPGVGVLRWPNGVKGRIYAAEAPESMRGPNLSWVWADEVEHWPSNESTWFEAVELALRAGWARALLTSTPERSSRLLKRLEERDDTVLTRASTNDNPFLPGRVRSMYYDLYGGTRVGRQELEGEYIEELSGALWTLDMIDRADRPPPMRRVVVAVDPAVSDNERSAEHGIVAIGLGEDGLGYVLRDRSRKGSPAHMASVAIALYRAMEADAIVVEVNNGGDWLQHGIHAVDSSVNVRHVRATRGKMVRAEPVAALYERHKVRHVGIFAELEEQMTSRVPGDDDGFDRFDALVWGLTDLMLRDRVGPISAYT